MLKYNELRKGIVFLINREPYEVLEYSFAKLQRGQAIAKTKIKNLKTGVILSRNFHQHEEFEEAEIKIRDVNFIFEHRGKYVFSESQNPLKRFELLSEVLGDSKKYLKPNSRIEAILFNNEIINIRIPIKMDFKIIECPPSFKGNTAQRGTKTALIETGLKIEVPMFIKVGDTIRINTKEDKYIERVN